jgi:two-component system, response regulator PdtaR
MFDAKQLRKHALECLRLQSDCMELAGTAHNPALQSHFVSMAEFWGALAVSGPSSNGDPDFQSRIADEMTYRLSRVVLIVEDDPLLGSLTAKIMVEAGFTALQAGNAREAVAILESRSDVALLLTSVAMPGGMDGLGLAHMVCKRWPAIKIVIASSQVQQTESNLPAGSRFFLKPYDVRIMISEIHAMIGP